MQNTAEQTVERLWSLDFILITLISLVTFLGFQMLLPTLPIYAKELGGSDASAGLVIGIFTFSAVLIRPFTGLALDRYGRKGIFLLGLLIFAVCVLAYTWAPSLIILLLIRFIHGFGWGLTSTSASTVATDIIPKSRLGEGMGYYGLAGTLSMALAPTFGLYVMNQLGFNRLFLISAAFVILAVILAFWVRYQKVGAPKAKFSLIQKTALPPTLVIFFVTMTYGAVVSFLALYAAQQGIKNIGPFFTVYALTLMIIRPLAGRLSDKKGFGFVIIPGIGFIILAMLLLYLAQGLPVFLVAASLYGLGFGAVQPSLQAMSVMSVTPERRGAATGTFFTGFDLGIGLSSIMWGAISQIIGYRYMFLSTVVPTLLALVFYLWVERKGVQK